MRTRQKSYNDYGLIPGEEKIILERIRAEKCHCIVLKAAVDTNEMIASELYYSIINQVSFEKLDAIRYIPVAKVDFYAYRRKCIALIRERLKE